MMPIQVMVVPVWVERLGWMLVHSLWQLAIVAVLAAVLLRSLRNRSARMRYAAAVAMLALMAIGPVVTWCLISVEPVRPVSSSQRLERSVTSRQMASVVQRPVNTEAGSVGVEDVRPVAVLAIPLAVEAEAVDVPGAGSALTGTSGRETAVTSTLPDRKPASTVTFVRESIEKIARAIKPRLPILVSVWLLGVLICSIRPIWGLWIQWRLRHTGLQPVPESIQSTLNALIQKLRLTRPVRIAESALVKVPLVVGYVHPMILLPASVITGLTSSQLEAVLAHELAHVRRHDWLINTLQVIAETLLFYHPAVWWLSSRIRQERELCCDDIALGLNVDKAVFARTLLTLEELRQKAMVPAMAATGADLAARVRRLLITSHVTPTPGGGTIMGMLVVVMSLVLLVTSLFASGPPEEAKKSLVNSTTTQRDEDATPAVDKDPLHRAEQKDETILKPNARRHTIQVFDENEQPVTGVEVLLQFQYDNERICIDAPLFETTDNNGIVQVEVPPKSDNLLVMVTAAGYAEFNGRQQATGESMIRLKRGRVIHVRAVDQSGNILRKAVPLLEQSQIWGHEFVLQADGTFKSPAVDMKRRLMRVVTAQENGPFLFSDLIDVAVAEAGPDGILDVVLKPGTKLTGRLDDSVPRPISEGYVRLIVIEGENHALRVRVRDHSGAEGRWENHWTWTDSAAVKPDGTFTFESVPSGGLAQVHVVTDGFMSANPSTQELEAVIVDYGNGHEATHTGLKQQMEGRSMWPHLVPVQASSVDVTIKCQPTASCNFRILDPSGNPVPDAAVSFSPNGIFINGGPFLPGYNPFQRARMVHDLFWGNAATAETAQHGRQVKEREWAERSFLKAKSDKDGHVKIRNLPGWGRVGYEVAANGFVLPGSPLYPPFGDSRKRYVDLVAGETIEATIYLERHQPVVEREILVVDKDGSPIPHISVAIAEMRVGKTNWQQWSNQRFGTAQSAITNTDGGVILQVPSVIDSLDVERIRLAINSESSDPYVYGELVEAPLNPDSGLIAILPDAQEKQRCRAKYGLLKEVLSGLDNPQLLQSMARKPSVTTLRLLLSDAKSEQPEPVELLEEMDFEKVTSYARVHVIADGESVLALIPARVRPLDGSRKDENDMNSLPECVFVFDPDGQLVATVGGEIRTIGGSSPDDVDIMCLVHEEDWFVRVTRFQKTGPFTHQSECYRIGKTVVASLKYYNYGSSSAWAYGLGKTTRSGNLYFGSPDSNSNNFVSQTVGVTGEGVAVNGSICWDGDKNRFFGAPTQSVDGTPLYKVDTEWSQEFSALNPKADQMVLSGGICENDHRYSWSTFVPQGYEATVRVSIPQVTSEPQIVEQKLAAGRHMIQFQAKPSDDGMTAKLQLGYGEDQQIQNADLPFQLGEQLQKPAIVNVLDAQKSVRLVERPLEGSEKTLTLEVLLNPLN
jgi:beta-lactamase regulating signal transducer with metallopeptidase domain